MGHFSWCTSDTRKSIPCFDTYVGAPETVYLLNPFGEPYKETDYEGYGVFGGRDVFELVAEWNRPFLSTDNISRPKRSQWADTKEGSEYYRAAMDRYEARCLRITEFASGKPDEYMEKHFGPDWKRSIGIDIACYEKDHVKLRYPIKIVEKPCSYEMAGISPHCPYQGGGYDEIFTRQYKQGIERVFDALLRAAGQYADKKADVLDDFFWASKLADDGVYVANTYPHLVVKDDDGHKWVDGEIYDFVLNECLGFEEDGSLQFGYGAISQDLADTLKAHGRSYGVLVMSAAEWSRQGLDAKISDAESKKTEPTTQTGKLINKEI